MSSVTLNQHSKLNKNSHIAHWIKSIVMCIPIGFILWFPLFYHQPLASNVVIYAKVTSICLFVLLFFLMQLTGKTYQYRRVLFVSMSVCLILGLVNKVIDAGGLMTSSMEDVLLSNHGYCPIALPMLVIPAIIKKVLIFPGSLFEGRTSFAFVATTWLFASLAIGRGFCSWFCVFGGFDEGFSSIGKKPMLFIDKIWTLLPWAILITVILISAETLAPTYCQYLCPWKTVSRVTGIQSLDVLIKTVLSVSLFVGLVVVIPILTKKRSQCTILCPLAALQSLTNKFNIFEIRIDKNKCNNCKKCIKKCPTLSIDSESIIKGKTLMSCTKCSKCIDICKNGAAFYHIKGTRLDVRTEVARNMFIYPAYILGAVIASNMMVKAIVNLSSLFIG